MIWTLNLRSVGSVASAVGISWLCIWIRIGYSKQQIFVFEKQLNRRCRNGFPHRVSANVVWRQKDWLTVQRWNYVLKALTWLNKCDYPLTWQREIEPLFAIFFYQSIMDYVDQYQDCSDERDSEVEGMVVQPDNSENKEKSRMKPACLAVRL